MIYSPDVFSMVRGYCVTGAEYRGSPEARRRLVNEHFPLGGDAKTGRNTPCPYGSGKKYKNCCGAPRSEA